jgi:hypothetical protein
MSDNTTELDSKRNKMTATQIKSQALGEIKEARMKTLKQGVKKLTEELEEARKLVRIKEDAINQLVDDYSDLFE